MEKATLFLCFHPRSQPVSGLGRLGRTLGQWLAGEGSKFACLPEFASLLASHARFHQAASDIMSKAGFGQPGTHDIDPLAECDFIEASNEIVRALVAILKKMLVAQ